MTVAALRVQALEVFYRVRQETKKNFFRNSLVIAGAYWGGGLGGILGIIECFFESSHLALYGFAGLFAAVLANFTNVRRWWWFVFGFSVGIFVSYGVLVPLLPQFVDFVAWGLGFTASAFDFLWDLLTKLELAASWLVVLLGKSLKVVSRTSSGGLEIAGLLSWFAILVFLFTKGAQKPIRFLEGLWFCYRVTLIPRELETLRKKKLREGTSEWIEKKMQALRVERRYRWRNAKPLHKRAFVRYKSKRACCTQGFLRTEARSEQKNARA